MSVLFAYYGDDFTGSTDALEALAMSGIRTVLFLGPPEGDRAAKFRGFQAVGIAGESRSRDPEWMRAHLPAVFRSLRSLRPAVTQYKVCSTFDSSAGTGNIGVAMEIGRTVFGSRCVPVVVAAPHLRRYILFGNLFAGQGEAVYRIDRHPTMSRHPVTPMREGDLRLHLREQWGGRTELFDLLALTGATAKEKFAGLIESGCDAILFDGLDERTQSTTGRLVLEAGEHFPFAVGSSGLTYALIRGWQACGRIPPSPEPGAGAKPADRIAVVSGSCSPVTEQQIRWAMGHGFAGFHASDLFDTGNRSSAGEALSRGQSVVIYSTLGLRDLQNGSGGEALGCFLGELLRELVLRGGVRRAVIAGGDTASHAAAQLGVDALTFEAPLAPGAPLCRAHSGDERMDGLELVLKGGQVGPADFFERVLHGRF